MKKLVVLVLAAATAMVLAVGSGSAGAASNAEVDCFASGGIDYVKDGSTAFCDYGSENVGNAPEHSNSQETDQTESGQGNLKKSEPVCTGPPGQCAQR